MPSAPSVRRATLLAAPLLCLTLGLAGCGDDGATPGTADDTTTSGGPQQPLVIDITIADGEVDPAGQSLEATVGQPIELHVDSDADDEVHVHSSPEHEYEVKPGDDQVFTFSIDQPGEVEIETHETGVVIAEVSVTP